MWMAALVRFNFSALKILSEHRRRRERRRLSLFKIATLV
jgi:hypothetical protein